MEIDRIELVLENVEYGNGDVWWRVNKLYKYNKTFFTYYFNDNKLYKIYLKNVDNKGLSWFVTTFGSQRHNMITVQDAVMDYNTKLTLNMEGIELPTELTFERRDLKFEPYCELKDDNTIFQDYKAALTNC
jgi:hypothetical protein